VPVVTLATEPAVHAVCDTRRAIRWQVAAWCLFGYLLLILVAWSAPAPDVAEPSPQPEQQVKAAFLYKFLSYVEWPAGAIGAASTPIVIGVLDADDIADELRTVVAKRRIGQHPLEVRRGDESNALDGVNVLFVGAGGADALSRLAPKAHEKSVLLVSDFANGLAAGSVINLVVVDNRVRFEVSLEAAERSDLKLSSRMLAVAMWVHPTR